MALSIGLVSSSARLPRADDVEAAPSDASAATDGARPSAPAEHPRPPHQTVSLRGRVVWLAEALERLYGISSDPDVSHAQVALETAEGRLYPIVKDTRGRGFLLDPRLMELDLDLLVRVHEGSPVVQVVRVYSLRDDGKYELDYWCDVCAIPMYELKDCECCQGPIRIRERRVESHP